jgi:CHAT domain-containing protein
MYLRRLVFSRPEADAILKAADGDGLEALGFEASRATATSPTLARHRIVHFATHGLLDNRHPELSGLVLSMVDRKGRPQNGFLDLQDIYNLSLPVDLVVLSACETALGKKIGGEGLLGLTRGFMYAGAQRVIASLWKVDDVATAELMKRFYKGLLHDRLPAPAALRRAQRELRQNPRWRAPYFWAPFVIEGR